MKQEAFCRELTQMTPDVPEAFHQRVEDFLAQQEHVPQAEKPVIHGRRALLIALAALLLFTAALAASRWGMFEALRCILGAQPPTADAVMQADLHQEVVNGVEITLKEAGYDGRTLLMQYSYRIPEAADDIEQAYALLDERNVGWWIDHFWIDGQCMDMAGNSGSDEEYSESTGEIIRTEYWRLDNIGVFLKGRVEIALPIGQRQPLEDYSYLTHPEKYDEDRQLLKPAKGLVTFAFNAGEPQPVLLTPPQEALSPEEPIRVKEAVLTPLMTYITLEMLPSADADQWLDRLELVDESGKILFPNHYGCNGYSDTWAEFTYPYLNPDDLPDQLWLAPVEDGSADMARALRVK